MCVCGLAVLFVHIKQNVIISGHHGPAERTQRVAVFPSAHVPRQSRWRPNQNTRMSTTARIARRGSVRKSRKHRIEALRRRASRHLLLLLLLMVRARNRRPFAKRSFSEHGSATRGRSRDERPVRRARDVGQWWKSVNPGIARRETLRQTLAGRVALQSPGARGQKRRRQQGIIKFRSLRGQIRYGPSRMWLGLMKRLCEIERRGRRPVRRGRVSMDVHVQVRRVGNGRRQPQGLEVVVR